MGIKKDRLVHRLESLGRIGATAAGGVTRLAYTPAYREAEQLVRRWMIEAGLDVQADAVGNLIGRCEGKRKGEGCLMLASHIDSVVNGGRYDGALGVIAAIDVAQALREDGVALDRSLEVVVFMDEEGARWGDGLYGSRAMTGRLSEGVLEKIDDRGMSRAEAMVEWSLDPTAFREAARDPAEIGAYVELHIEQGAVLESENISIGVVDAIAGPLFLAVQLHGRADHAGATPMGELRRDALIGAAEAILAAEAAAKATSSSCVATVGRIEARPGAINVIPGEVMLTLDIRDIDGAVRDRAEAAIRAEIASICKRRCLTFTIDEYQRTRPVSTSPIVSDAISAACRGLGLPVFRLNSGAAHDAQMMTVMAEVGMIFVRCRDGVSHSPEEYVAPRDAFRGAQVLYHTALHLGSID
jgi:allantoate deiminase